MHTFAHVVGVPGTARSPRPPAFHTLTLIAAILLGACGAPPQNARVVTLAYTEGGVTSYRGGSPADATKGETLAAGDEVTTGPDGLAILQLDDGTLLVVTGAAWLKIQALDGTRDKPVSHFYLHGGSTFTFHQGELPADASYIVETPLGSGSIQASSMSLSYMAGAGDTLSCLEGSCSYSAMVSGALERVPVPEAEWVNHDEGADIGSPAPMDSGLRHEWDWVMSKMDAAGTKLGVTPACYCLDGALWCNGQVNEERSDACSTCSCGPAGTENARNLYCTNDKIFYNAPSCLAAMDCKCVDRGLVCITKGVYYGTTYTNKIYLPGHPSCKDVTCACGGSAKQDYMCSNGDVWPNFYMCEVCTCGGTDSKDLVCNTGLTIPGACAPPTRTPIVPTDTPKPKERNCGPNDPSC